MCSTSETSLTDDKVEKRANYNFKQTIVGSLCDSLKVYATGLHLSHYNAPGYLHTSEKLPSCTYLSINFRTLTSYQIIYLTLSTLSDDMWVMLSRLPCNWSLTTSSKSSIFSEPLLRVRCCNTPSQLYILYRLIVEEGTKEGAPNYFWRQTLCWAWRLGREIDIDRQRKITWQVL